MKKFQNVFFFLFALVASLLIYSRTVGAGFVTDEIGWFLQYQSLGWQGVFFAFNDKALHFVYHIMGFSLWKIFGFNGAAWMIVFASLHALVTLLSFSVFMKMLQREGVQNATNIASTGALFFLFSPYATEAVVWYACIHYLVCSVLLLLAFEQVLKYIQKGQAGALLLFYALFLLSVFTLEISFSFPLLIAAYLLFGKGITARKQKIVTLVLPSFALVGFYFCMSSLLRGSAVGHYGAATHFNFSIPLLVGNWTKYSAKIFLYTQFLPYNIRESLYLFFETKVWTYSIFIIGSIAITGFVFSKHKLSDSARASVLTLVFFTIALLPVMNLFFTYLINIEGDRLSYFAGIFAAQFLALFCYSLNVNYRKALVIALLLLHVYFLNRNISAWSDNVSIRESLLQTYKWQEAGKVFILNLPDNFRGSYMYRDDEDGAIFEQELKLRGVIDGNQTVKQILGFNMESLSDSLKVEQISENELKVSFAQYGNWWWQKGVGASSYSTEDYDVRIGEWGEYYIRFKHQYPQAVYLYLCGTEWREIKAFNNASAL